MQSIGILEGLQFHGMGCPNLFLICLLGVTTPSWAVDGEHAALNRVLLYYSRTPACRDGVLCGVDIAPLTGSRPAHYAWDIAS